jgi:hypothetical protein
MPSYTGTGNVRASARVREGQALHPIDRFTKDEASAKVWWPYALVLLIAFILTFPGQNRAIRADRDDAAALAAGWSAQVAEDPALATTIADGAATVEAVRTWTADGSLAASTDDGDEVGSAAALNDEFLQAATAASGQPVTETSSSTPTGEEAEPVTRVYTAVDASTIVEVEYLDASLLAATSDWWRTLQIVLGIAVLLVLALAIASMRTPVARIGAGVRFYPESVPPGAVVLEADEAEDLRQAGMYARRRLTEQRARVDELEHEKLRLEGELQRSLSARSLATGPRTAIPRPGAAEVAPPQPSGMPAPAPVPDVPVVRIPDPEPEAAQERVEAPAAEPEPVTGSTPEPVETVAEPEPTRKPEPVEVATEPDPEPEPLEVATEPDPEPLPAAPSPAPVARTAASAPDDSMGFVLVPETELAAPPAPRRRAAAEVVRVPDADDDGRHDAEVLDVLERLVEPVGTGSTADPGEMRARLARTAARKKPGSRADERFQE